MLPPFSFWLLPSLVLKVNAGYIITTVGYTYVMQNRCQQSEYLAYPIYRGALPYVLTIYNNKF